IFKIQRKEYVEQKERRFYATEKGKLVTDLLVKHFPHVMDLKFTSHMEEDLDKIESRQMAYQAVLNEFWNEFKPELDRAEAEMPRQRGQETGENCPKCGKPLIVNYARKTGKKFIGCSGWRKEDGGCDYFKPPEGQPEAPQLQVEGEVKCPTCGKPMAQRFGK